MLLDEDVEVEQRMATEMFDRASDNQEQALIVRDMSKRYGNFRAVKGLSFTVKQGQDLALPPACQICVLKKKASFWHKIFCMPRSSK